MSSRDGGGGGGGGGGEMLTLVLSLCLTVVPRCPLTPPALATHSQTSTQYSMSGLVKIFDIYTN